MTEFLSATYQSPNWFFITLGGILLISELFGAYGYALWSGVAAILVGLIAWILPLSWVTLWILFAALTVLSAYLWWLWLQKYYQKQPTIELLNQPQKQLLGVKTVVVDPIVNGSGRIKIQDGTWTAACNENLAKGTAVQVVKVDGLTAHVEKIK